MKIQLAFLLLLFSSLAAAKAPKIYRCVQLDGAVVIQDRRCETTDSQLLQPNKAKKLQPKRQKAQTQARSVVPPTNYRPTNRSLPENLKRSPYFTFGWDRFIPANWVLLKINTSRYEQLLLSRFKFKSLSQFEQGVKLSVYKNTIESVGLSAFAQALQLYHQIRDNTSNRLVDSQFKSHTNYKVFNIKYMNAQQQVLLTEFYIDESHNDLFVVTVQAREAQWQANWQLAAQIINQL